MSESVSITLTRDESVVIARIKLVTTELLQFIMKSGDARLSRWSWMIEAFITEGLDEIADAGASPESIEAALDNFGRVLTWCGNGDPSILPPNVRDYMYKNHREMLAITAGKKDAPGESD